jgi:hypothetical protein
MTQRPPKTPRQGPPRIQADRSSVANGSHIWHPALHLVRLHAEGTPAVDAVRGCAESRNVNDDAKQCKGIQCNTRVPFLNRYAPSRLASCGRLIALSFSLVLDPVRLMDGGVPCACW